MGRPPKPEGQTVRRTVTVKLTDDEYQGLQELVARHAEDVKARGIPAEVTISSVVRSLVRAGRVKPDQGPPSDLIPILVEQVASLRRRDQRRFLKRLRDRLSFWIDGDGSESVDVQSRPR